MEGNHNKISHFVITLEKCALQTKIALRQNIWMGRNFVNSAVKVKVALVQQDEWQSINF